MLYFLPYEVGHLWVYLLLLRSELESPVGCTHVNVSHEFNTNCLLSGTQDGK